MVHPWKGQTRIEFGWSVNDLTIYKTNTRKEVRGIFGFGRVGKAQEVILRLRK